MPDIGPVRMPDIGPVRMPDIGACWNAFTIWGFGVHGETPRPSTMWRTGTISHGGVARKIRYSE